MATPKQQTKQPKQQTKHKSIAEALAAAQANMSNAVKNKKNPHYKSTFADFPAVRDIVMPALSAEGIACIQHIDGDDGVHVILRTTLHWGDSDGIVHTLEAGSCKVKLEGRNAAQSAGSSSSYFKRYQMAGAGGIAQADDDGESTVSQQRTETRPQRQRTPPPAPQGPKPKPGAVPCPKCQSKTWDNFAYREWMKSNPRAKKKAALACDKWQKCGWTIWPRSEATAFLSDSAIASKPKTAPDEMKSRINNDGMQSDIEQSHFEGGVFDDGLSKT